MISHQHKLQHFFLRAGFGETPWEIAAMKNKDIKEVVKSAFASSASFKQIHYLPYPLKENREKKGVSPSQFLAMILKSRKESEELNVQWLFKMTHTKAWLREKMVFFWHNHFSTSVPFSYLMQVQNNTIRRHALGSFRDLLFAIAKDPAMILYLNNQENKKDHPNENFAREVMELFTLGIGNYSEKDIQEAARAFTGWGIDGKGEFVFRRDLHDDGVKVFRGKSGNFTGEDILNQLLDDPQTAGYITEKIYKEFVNPVVDKNLVQQLANDFYTSGYSIQSLMESIFLSDWFYDPKNVGVKIASPVELIVRYAKLLKLKFRNDRGLIQFQRALGQVMFFPPNVAGWPGDQKWIDSASLLLRLNLPLYIMNGAVAGVKGKPAFEQAPEEGISEIKSQKVISEWGSLVHHFKSGDPSGRISRMVDALIQSDRSRIDLSLLNDAGTGDTDKSIIKELVAVMSLPEFQLI